MKAYESEIFYVSSVQGVKPVVSDPVEAPRLHDEQNDELHLRQNIISTVGSLNIGEWYIERKNGLDVRHKLIDKDYSYRFLLFSNLSGTRSLRIGFDDADAALKVDTLQRIDTQPVFEKALDYSCRRMALALPAKGRKETEYAQQPTDGSSLNIGLALEGADCSYSEILSEAQRMRVGGWAQLIADKDEPVACRLGAKSIETGRLLFVDSEGTRFAELSPEVNSGDSILNPCVRGVGR